MFSLILAPPVHELGCFDREAELLPLIEAAESPEELEEIMW